MFHIVCKEMQQLQPCRLRLLRALMPGALGTYALHHVGQGATVSDALSNHKFQFPVGSSWGHWFKAQEPVVPCSACADIQACRIARLQAHAMSRYVLDQVDAFPAKLVSPTTGCLSEGLELKHSCRIPVAKLTEKQDGWQEYEEEAT